MAGRLERAGELLRENGVAVGAAVVLLAGLGLGLRFVARSRAAPEQKRVLQITGVIIKPEPAPPPKALPPPPAPPREAPREETAQPQTRLVEVKITDVPPPDAPRTASAEPAAGPLALAGEATGEGDAFGLAGNPGGRSLLGPGRIGDGTGEGEGGLGGDGGASDAGARFGWFFGRIASEIQTAFQRMKKTSTAQARVELKIWVDPSGKVSRVQLLRSTGDEDLDRAIQSVVGLRLREAIPADLPNPAIYRFTARRPG